MPKPVYLLLLLLVIFSFGWFSTSGRWKRIKSIHFAHAPVKHPYTNPVNKKIKDKAAEARQFAAGKNFNSSTCFLIDMSLPSGQNRFFVYNLGTDSVVNAGLVTHGRCNEDWLEGRRYGNTIGCGCTSLGKYRIGNSYTGRFGLAFKLHGLDKTNDNAFARFVVLHSHECVPASEVKEEICQSDGCPTVAPDFLQELKVIINNSGKPLLLWIFE